VAGNEPIFARVIFESLSIRYAAALASLEKMLGRKLTAIHHCWRGKSEQAAGAADGRTNRIACGDWGDGKYDDWKPGGAVGIERVGRRADQARGGAGVGAELCLR